MSYIHTTSNYEFLHGLCAGGRGVTGRVYLDIGGGNDIVDLYGSSKYPDNPDFYFVYPSYQPESFRRYFS